MSHLSLSGQNKENNKMASPRRRRLIKALRAGKAQPAAAPAPAEPAPRAVEAPAPLVEAPVLEEEVVEEEVVEEAPKVAKKSFKKKAK